MFAFSTPHHSVQRCRSKACGHLFAGDHGAGQGVMAPDVDPVKDDPAYPKRNERLIRYWRRIGFLRPGARVLDVGAGSGHMEEALSRETDLSLACVEPGVNYHPRLEEVGCRVYRAIEDIPGEELYDAILLIEVVEHVDDPVRILRAIRQRLAPGGRLFLTTPAGDHRRGKQDPWTLGAYNTPYHIHFFTPRSLEHALRLAGFKRRRYRFVMAFYPNDDKEDAVYESFWAWRYAKEREIRYRFHGSNHLTYFAG
jgi:2-polyprenyl-3-methyl-5-hydroxy-6-metoxy-1,4-benzoquinol methylase